MILGFLFFLNFCLQTAAHVSAPPSDAAFAETIKQLLHTVLTSDNTNAENAQVEHIFMTRGLPTIGEVGDQASYEFVVLLAGKDLSPKLRSEALPKIKSSGAQGTIPADAATYYEARLRIRDAQESAMKHPPENPSLRDEIELLVKDDQDVRQQKGFDAARLVAVDAQHRAALQSILDRYGVPTYASVGPQAAGDFLLMIQHQPSQFREQILPKLKELVEAGQADPEKYAMEYDLAQRDAGKPQLYGERLECNPGEPMHEAPMEDSAHVNERRAALGLIRVELYEALLKEVMPQFCPSDKDMPR